MNNENLHQNMETMKHKNLKMNVDKMGFCKNYSYLL